MRTNDGNVMLESFGRSRQPKRQRKRKAGVVAAPRNSAGLGSLERGALAILFDRKCLIKTITICATAYLHRCFPHPLPLRALPPHAHASVCAALPQ